LSTLAACLIVLVAPHHPTSTATKTHACSTTVKEGFQTEPWDLGQQMAVDCS
jgi:hypothetical protein